MDSYKQRLLEEMEFWQMQIDLAEKRKDEEVLPRLNDALGLVEFKIQRHLGEVLAKPNISKNPISDDNNG